MDNCISRCSYCTLFQYDKYFDNKLILTLTDTGDHKMLFGENFDYDDSPNISASELFDLDYLYHATYFPLERDKGQWIY